MTKGKLRFALDTVGKDSATQLQETLQQSGSDKQAHLVGLTGLPKARLPGVKYHSIPIKAFHTIPPVGERTMEWLEELLAGQSIQPPEVIVAEGGLEGINQALDRLRSGNTSAKRIVVPLNAGKAQSTNGSGVDKDRSGQSDDSRVRSTLEQADKLNANPSRVKFA